MLCNLCGYEEPSLKQFSNHIQKVHKLPSQEYTVTHLLSGKHPKCLHEGCNETPRYVSFMFKKFCHNHHLDGQAAGGANKRGTKIQELSTFIRSLGINVHMKRGWVHLDSQPLRFTIRTLTVKEKNGLARNDYRSAQISGLTSVGFFADEWEFQRAVCESMIRSRLKLNATRISARKTVLKQITATQSQEFLKRCHVQRATNAKAHFGLFFENRLVGVATVRAPIQQKYGRVSELARMAFELNTTVIGGASKLMKAARHWSLEKGYVGILSYAELRYGEGCVYSQCGFELVGESTKNYWYSNGKERFNRFTYRAQEGLSEALFAESKGVWPVWGVGNKVYLMKFCDI